MTRNTVEAKGDPSIRLVIKLEGGLVQWIGTDNTDHKIQIAIIDYDTDGADDDEIVEIPQDDSGVADAIARIEEAEVDVEFIASTFHAIRSST